MSKQEKVFEQLDKLLDNKASRGFLNHLVKAYFPTNKVDKVFLTPKGDFKCSITLTSLVSVNDVIDGMDNDEYKDYFFKYLHNMTDPKLKMETPVANMLQGRELGIQGTKTDTFMSLPVYHIFQNWIENKIMTGDKHIKWLLKGNNPFIKKSERKKNVPNAVKTREVRATFSLGDIPELQKLKDKLKGN